MTIRRVSKRPLPLVLASAIALAGTLVGCRELPEPIGVGPHPADPSARVSKSSYRPITEGMHDYEIVQPKSWGSVNERVAPKKQ